MTSSSDLRHAPTSEQFKLETLTPERILWILGPIFLAYFALSQSAYAVATLTSITPTSAYPGQTVNVTFHGSGLAGTRAVSGWGSCVSVTNLAATNTSVTATFHLHACTLIELHTLALVTSAGDTNTVSFEILKPAVTSITPASAGLSTSVNVVFSGHGLSGITAVTGWGSCVTVSNLLSSDTSVTATFNIEGCALIKTHTLALATPAGISNSVSFEIAAPKLTVSSGRLNFGDQPANTAVTQILQLTSAGTIPVTVSSAKIAGTDFSMSGAAFPVTLDPGIAISLRVQFDPPAAGRKVGSLIVSSNSSSSGTTVVTLGGVGISWVKLTWQAPSKSLDPVAGYNVYRSLSGSNLFQQLNSSPVTQAAYSDRTVEPGSSYDYYVVSVDTDGVRSGPSKPVTLAIP